jgi:hypothetical protein
MSVAHEYDFAPVRNAAAVRLTRLAASVYSRWKITDVFVVAHPTCYALHIGDLICEFHSAAALEQFLIRFANLMELSR